MVQKLVSYESSKIFTDFYYVMLDACYACYRNDNNLTHTCFDFNFIKTCLEKSLESAFENGDISYNIYFNYCRNSDLKLHIDYKTLTPQPF